MRSYFLISNVRKANHLKRVWRARSHKTESQYVHEDMNDAAAMLSDMPMCVKMRNDQKILRRPIYLYTFNDM